MPKIRADMNKKRADMQEIPAEMGKSTRRQSSIGERFL